MSFIDKINTPNLAITSDSHFYHGNIINYCSRFDFVSPQEAQQIVTDRHSGKRPVVSKQAVEYAAERMINEWNIVCDSNTTVIHCGDFAWVKGVDELKLLLARLNFRKLVLVSGNHDDVLWKWHGSREAFKTRLFSSDRDRALSALRPKNPDDKNVWKLGRMIEVYDSAYEAIVNDQHIYFSHYANRVWPSSHNGSWNLYGHTHNQMYDDPYLLSMDVGVDSAKALLGSYRPFTFNEVKAHMAKKKFVVPTEYLEKSGKKDDVLPHHQYEYAQILQNIERVQAEFEVLNARAIHLGADND